MDFNATLEFCGKDGPRYIGKDEETGHTLLVFDNDGSEIYLSFEPEMFKALSEAVNQFAASGKEVCPARHKGGRVNLDLFLPLFEEKITV